MLQDILIIKNSHEGPGLLQDILTATKLSSKTIELGKGEPFTSPKGYKALVVLGGPDSANDNTPKMQQELQRIKEALDLKIPYLGICLGLQTLVKAAGGSVIQNSVKEIGFRGPDNELFTIDLTSQGKQDPLFNGLNDILNVFQLHGETVQPTKDMQLLGTGKFCKDQIVRVGSNAYGLQCHFELTEEMFLEWFSADTDIQKLDKNKLLADFQSIKNDYLRIGKKLFENFVRLL